MGWIPCGIPEITTFADPSSGLSLVLTSWPTHSDPVSISCGPINTQTSLPFLIEGITLETGNLKCTATCM